VVAESLGPQRGAVGWFDIRPRICWSVSLLTLDDEGSVVDQHVVRSESHQFGQVGTGEMNAHSNLKQAEICRSEQGSAVIYMDYTWYKLLLDLQLTDPELPATSSENLFDHSLSSILIAAFFLPKKTFGLKENNTGPTKSGGWYMTLVESSDC